MAAGQDPLSDDILVPAFALVAEAAQRTLGVSYYDVQLLGGMALVRGVVAEIQTGEGKTFVAAFPAFLHALSGSGVHVMTVNAYLAQRDYQLMAPLYEALGLRVGWLAPGANQDQKRHAYACDITYGPGYEFGFDYLRDQAARFSPAEPRLGETFLEGWFTAPPSRPTPVQRGQAWAVVDEADSVMIDEATTPLVLSEGTGQTTDFPTDLPTGERTGRATAGGPGLRIGSARERVRLTGSGTRRVAAAASRAAALGLERPWARYVEQALQAKFLLHRDVHYTLRDGQLLLVDQNTGRVFADRSWQEGLQQAVQAKESATITGENHPLARISRQRLFRLYQHLCGMTGTTAGSEREFRRVYGLPVIAIPTHRACQRTELPTRYFADQAAKWRAVIADVVCRRRSGQPILVGTRTIEDSEMLAQAFAAQQIPFQLLNGKQDAEEAAIVAQAGQVGAVTIATNMAGRGTDIQAWPRRRRTAADCTSSPPNGTTSPGSIASLSDVRRDKETRVRASSSSPPTIGSCAPTVLVWDGGCDGVPLRRAKSPATTRGRSPGFNSGPNGRTASAARSFSATTIGSRTSCPSSPAKGLDRAVAPARLEPIGIHCRGKTGETMRCESPPPTLRRWGHD